MAEFPKISLVLGGVASGKSAFAERLCASAAQDRIYLATAQALDDEMTAKIKRHQSQRRSGWTTLEVPLAVAATLSTIKPNQILLLDCLTLWLSNHLFASSDLPTEFANLSQAISAMSAPIILVSNELGQGGVAENSLARRFQVEQGRLNQQIAAIADLVVMVRAGLPQVLKGQLPNGLT